MRFIFALTIVLLCSLVSPAFCQPPDGPDIFPDEHTRKIARELDLKSVKEIYIQAGSTGELTVTDPKVIALIIKGFKTANTTYYSNKVDYVEVTGKDGRALISYGFSLTHFPEVSPELMEGFKAAGIEPEGWQAWKEREQRTKTQLEIARQLLTWALPLLSVALLGFFVFRRRAKRQT